MLQKDSPDDYVVCTGKTHSVRDFCKEAFKIVDLNYKDYVEIDMSLFRPAEVNYLVGDYSKAKRELGWEPSISFNELIKIMVQEDLKSIQ